MLSPGYMKKTTVPIALIFLLQVGLAIAMESGVSKTQNTETSEIAQTVNAMRQISTDSMETRIPAAAKPLLTTLKHQLRDLIHKSLNAHGSKSKNMAGVQKAVLKELKKQGVSVEEPKSVVFDKNYVDTGYVYGEIYRVAIKKLPHHPDMAAAITTIGICCGQDSSLYIFKKSGQQWELILAQEADNYDEVSGAQGSFHYGVSQHSDMSRFFVVTSDVNPWCSSNWQSIHYYVLRVGAAPYQPKILLQKSETVYLGNDNLGDITILSDGFKIGFDSYQGLDAGVLIRKHIAAYRIDGDNVRRVPPLAKEPEGFLDEWFGLPWTEAVQWIEPSALPELRKWHQRFKAERHIHFFKDFIFSPPARKIGKGQWQIGIELSPDPEGSKLPFGMPESVYFTVVLKKGAYFLKSVSE